MFKIKVGLKSFQTHSMQKCIHQIGRVLSYLKQTPTSFPAGWKEMGHNFTPPQAIKGTPTSKRKRYSNLPAVKQEVSTLCFLQSQKEREQFQPSTDKIEPFSGNKIRPTSKQTFAQQIYGIKSTLYKQENSCANICTNDLQGSGRSRGNANQRFARESFSDQKKVETFLRITPLPTLVKKITTLRSPHIDKKSREQFEWRREKAQIAFDLNSVAQISFVLFVLMHSRFPGVEIEIGVESRTYFV